MIKPVLGLLLVTNEPLVRDHLKHLLILDYPMEVDGEQLNQALERLGGLVVVDDQQRYSLFHLKFRDYLRQDAQHLHKRYVFDREDEQHWHNRFIIWCEQSSLVQIWENSLDAIEQGRRRYARQHYISHIYHARDWNKLFKVLDEGTYGKAKVQDDQSMHSYSLDLDYGRKASASQQWNLQEAISYLPYLWRYSLLRCSLASQADKYPREAFDLMLRLGQETKALGLAELLTSREYKSEIYILTANHLIMQPERVGEAMQLFFRAEQIILSIPDEGSKNRVLMRLAAALALVGRWQEAKRSWQKAEQFILSISNTEHKVEALTRLATALRQAGRWQEAKRIISSISVKESKAQALAALGTALVQAGRWQEAERCWQEAEQVISSFSDNSDKAQALIALGTALAQGEHGQEAERCWQEAEQVISSIFYEGDKAQALWKLVIAFAQDHKHSQIVRVVQREWLQTVSRTNALDLFSLVLSLVPHYSKLATALYDAFVWVDSFLKG